MGSELFGGTISFINQVLDLRNQGHQLHLANVANQDTPGYKEQKINFKTTLKAMSGDESVKKMDRTDDRHMTANGAVGGMGGAEIYQSDAPGGLDGNNVSPEKEMASMSENALMYSANVTLLRKELNMLRLAIRGRL